MKLKKDEAQMYAKYMMAYKSQIQWRYVDWLCKKYAFFFIIS